jgi:hypothetical protein
MPSDRTTVTELGTALGMLGQADIDEALRSPTPVMHSLSPEMWERLSRLRAGGAYDGEFHASWANGQAFLAADDGLRGRLPKVVEWKGTGRAPGDEVAPIDLRIDHVYLVSCKYLSNILFNVSPSHVFDDLLVGALSRGGRVDRDHSTRGGDWYAAVAPAEYQALYEAVRDAAHGWDSGGEASLSSAMPLEPSVRAGRARAAVSLPGLDDADGDGRGGASRPAGPVGDGGVARTGVPPDPLRALPSQAIDLTSQQRDALGQWLRPGWPAGAKALYQDLSSAVASASARRWDAALGESAREAMLWRLLRIGSAPYFVLGCSAARSLRLRIATSWDWRQRYRLASFTVEPQRGGQPRVGWEALVRDRVSHELHEVTGHIEVRWSHGRFGGLPEAKGYLDAPHHLVPGYFALA